jgi:hypothetical protein
VGSETVRTPVFGGSHEFKPNESAGMARGRVDGGVPACAGCFDRTRWAGWPPTSNPSDNLLTRSDSTRASEEIEESRLSRSLGVAANSRSGQHPQRMEFYGGLR